MSANAHTRGMLIDVLSRGVLGPQGPTPDEQKVLTEDLRSALLAIGSETPCNVAAVSNIEFAAVDEQDRSVTVVGPKLTGEPLLLSNLFWRLEGTEIPDEIQRSFPGLTEEKWNAAVRFVILLLAGLEKDIVAGGS